MCNPMEMQMAKAKERERRLCQLESAVVDHQSMLARLSHAFKSHVAMSDDNEPHEYRFKTADAALVSLAEISHDVTRAVPVLEVVVQGAEYQRFHHLLIHDAIVRKAQFINNNAHSADPESVTLMNNATKVMQRLSPVAPAVSGLDLNRIELSFAEVIDCLVFVQNFNLRNIGAEAVTMVVRPR